VILLKLFALPSLYRQGNSEKIFQYEADVAVLYQRYRPKLEPPLSQLMPFVDEDQVRELRNIVSDIQGRIERVDRATRGQGESGLA
jgi:hypothetical protein